MTSRRRFCARVLGIFVLVWLVCGWGLAPALWAQGVPSSQTDPNEKPTNTEVAGGDASLGVLEEGLVDSEPSNSAFYQPSLHYPAKNLMDAEPRLQRQAWVWSAIAVVLLAMLTWPLNEVEALSLKRELRLASGSRRRRFTLVHDQAQEVVPEVTERQVGHNQAAGNVAPVTEVNCVPLLHCWHRLDGRKANGLVANQTKVGVQAASANWDEQATSANRGEQTTAAEATPGLARFVPSSLANPLRLFTWQRAAHQTFLPLTDRRISPGLHIIVCSAPLHSAIKEVVFDLLQRGKGCVAVATSECDSAQFALALAGAEGSEPPQRLGTLRRNYHLVNKSLRRLLFPRGGRIYMAEFLRQLERGARKRGIEAVVLDGAERYEIGAMPQVLPVDVWLAELQRLATHGSFPVFLVLPSEGASADWPYPRYIWTELREGGERRKQLAGGSDATMSGVSVADRAERG